MQPVKYANELDAHKPSGLIWRNCPWESFKSGREPGWVFEDDFVNWSTTSAAPYTILEADGGSSEGQLATEVGGVLRLTKDTTDNDEVGIALSATAGCVKATANSGNPFWFEAKIRTNAITEECRLIGLANEGAMAADLCLDDGVDADMLDTSAPDFLGFASTGTTAAGLDAIYMDQATVGAHIIHQADAQTLVAATWYKVGIYFDGGTVLRFFIDNVQVGTDLATGTAEVPDGEELTFIYYAKNGTGAAVLNDIDWVRIAQARYV